jgi:tRNA (cmo5U34)-methyltransferase
MTQKFTFASREEGFDNHIDNSIRGYSNLWNDILNISQYFVENDRYVFDLGCSTGKLLRAMAEQNKTFAPEAKYVGIEIEEDFSAFFDSLLNPPNVQYWQADVYEYRNTMLKFETTLVTSIFTLQFMTHAHRQEVFRTVYKMLDPGGAFIFAEKTIATSARIQDIRTFTHYDFKRQNFSDKDILDKEKDLRHMMKPNTRSELIGFCHDAGFRSVDSFWQNHAFTGFIAIKE